MSSKLMLTCLLNPILTIFGSFMTRGWGGQICPHLLTIGGNKWEAPEYSLLHTEVILLLFSVHGALPLCGAKE